MVFQSGTRSERNFVRQRNDAEEYSWEERYLAGLEEAYLQGYHRVGYRMRLTDIGACCSIPVDLRDKLYSTATWRC